MNETIIAGAGFFKSSLVFPMPLSHSLPKSGPCQIEPISMLTTAQAATANQLTSNVNSNIKHLYILD